nr:reverse transcriptase domain-containing protein [Tanacetum cinerariifolium]
MLRDLDDVQDASDDDFKINAKGKVKVGDEELSKPFKEVIKCPFTRRIVEFSSPGHRMPTNAKIYDETGDSEDHVGRFVGMGNKESGPCRSGAGCFSKLSMTKQEHELSKRFSNNIPKTVDEMLKRVDDYLRSEEAFRNTELPKGEFQRKEVPLGQWGQRNKRHQR